jgi:hypothetical protein
VPAGDHVARIGRVDREVGFRLAVAIDDAELRRAVARGDGERVVRVAAVGVEAQAADQHLRARRIGRASEH